MQKWPQVTVAIVAITAQGRAWHVALDVGVAPHDTGRLHEGRARAEGDVVIYDGPPCNFTMSYRIVETGERRPGRRLGDGIFRPRCHCTIQIAPPAT